MNTIYLKSRTLTTRCLWVRVNVGIQTIFYIFLSMLFHYDGKKKTYIAPRFLKSFLESIRPELK